MKNKVLKFIAGVILAMLCVLATGCGSGEEKLNNTATAGDAGHRFITPTPITSGNKDDVGGKLPSCKNELVRTTVSAYYQALKRQNIEAIKAQVSAPVNVTDSIFSRYTDLEDIKIKRIYSIESSAPVDYICFVYYELKIKDVPTLVPALDQLYVTQSGDNYKIINGAIPVSAYEAAKEKVNGNQDIVGLKENIDKLFVDAVNAEPLLKDKIKLENDDDSQSTDEPTPEPEGQQPEAGQE